MPAALDAVARSSASRVVVARGGAYFYVYPRTDFQRRLLGAAPAITNVYWALGGLHETDSSPTQEAAGRWQALAPITISHDRPVVALSGRVPVAIELLPSDVARPYPPSPRSHAMAPQPPSPDVPTGRRPMGAEPPARAGSPGDEVVPRAAPALVKPAIVSDGFSSPEDPGLFLRDSTPLRPGSQYFYWFEIGPELALGAIASGPNPQIVVPGGALLVVLLFALSDDQVLNPAAVRAEFRMLADGRAVVERQPLAAAPPSFARPAGEGRALFPVNTSTREGTLRLRSSVYHNGTLVQSRLVEARVAQGPATLDPVTRATGAAVPTDAMSRALRSTVDYVLSHSLNPAVLVDLPGHELSIMMNAAGDDHGFTVFGQNDFALEARFDGPEIAHFLNLSRSGLRHAAWNDENRWSGQPYRYLDTHTKGNPLDTERLKKDLVHLAIRGGNVYDQIASRLAAGLQLPGATNRQKRDTLRARMRAPSSVQLALYRSAQDVLPIALFYDYEVLSEDQGNMTLCDAFIRALQTHQPLDQQPCFRGLCPHGDGDGTVVCPGGFWGYRHVLGVPLGVKDEAAGTIEWSGSLSAIFAASQDFDLAGKHELNLGKLRDRLRWHPAKSLTDLQTQMTQTAAQIIYFYCHGGVTANGLPWFRLGGESDRFFMRPTLDEWGLDWQRPRAPLILLNGCETVAVEPDIAIEFVSAFVQDAGAAGVLGTDITIFEELAVDFAEACLGYFLSGRQSIGEAVRLARLDLLVKGNPLGLVYVPFVLGGLKLVEQNV